MAYLVRCLVLWRLVMFSGAPLWSAEPPRPNIILIFVDDLGYGDISPFGSQINRTPNLEQMASEGVRFTSFYAAAAVCSPSRAALMTGCYPIRVGLAEGPRHAVLFPEDGVGLNPQELTVAEMLQAAGYATGCFGKWHLGDQPPFLPNRHGFDQYFGIPYSNDMWPLNIHPRTGESRNFPPLPILRGEEVVETVDDMDDQAQLCKQFTDAAVEFIKRHREEPFFVYLPHAFVHHPRAARERFLKQAAERDEPYLRPLPVERDYRMRDRTQAQIEEVDWSAGRILEVVRDSNLDDRTLILFTSDNGGAPGCVNRPLRGGKGTCWEGGFRVPTLAWWPGVIPAGSTCDAVAAAMDVLPTCADYAGVELARDQKIDGKSIAPLLQSPEKAVSPHEKFFYYSRRHLKAVRSGPWKLHAGGQLYHLQTDIGEQHNVAKRHPQVVQRLALLLNEARQELGDGSRNGRDVRPAGVVSDPQPLAPRPKAESRQN